ncbi:M28 family peptidase [Candidatus Bathyarchaeota archaeon]|nr:M28 family peptidase [Candidatus Bathyarchaeota archaeon]
MKTNTHLEIDKAILGEVYTSTESMDNLTELCDEYGSRFPGTPGDKGSVDFMVQKLKSYGLENAHYETFKLPGWVRGKAKLSVIEPIEKELECISLPLCLAGTVEAELIYLAEGPVEVYERMKAEIEGKIVLISNRNLPGTRSLHRTEKFYRSVLAGAKGWIYMNQNPGVGPVTGGVSPIIPSLGLGYEEGMFLIRLLKRKGRVKVRIETTDKNMEMTSYNVVADIPGTSGGKEYTLVGAHYEGHDIAQGAVDSGSGAATVIEIARVLNMFRDKIKRRIRFVCFGVEEIGLYGSKAYVEQHIDEMADLRFMINLDSAAEHRRKGISLHGHPELDAVFREFGEEMKTELPQAQRVSPYSDHWPFFLKGVPTGGGGDPGGAGPLAIEFQHSKYDTLDKVDLRSLRDSAAQYSRLILRVTNLDEWPGKHKTKEQVNTFVKAQGFDDTVALIDRTKAYVRKWQVIHPETQAWLDRPEY